MKKVNRFVLIAIVFFGFTISLNAQIKPQMLLVEGGTFDMGNPFTDAERKGDPDEKPVHSVTLDNFLIGKYEVTVKEYKQFINDKSFKDFSNLREHKMPEAPDSAWLAEHPDTKKYYPLPTQKWWGWVDDFPMQHVTWYDAIAYCNWLSEKEGLQPCYFVNQDFGITVDLEKNGYRLPTEAEWEFAARGGKLSKNTLYSGSAKHEEVGWTDETTSYKGPEKVGTKKSNELGIFDMTGNVWEWCSDYYAKDFYARSPKKNPLNNSHNSWKVIRGGSWHYRPEYATITSRDGPEANYTNFNYGFRLVKKAQ